ncbi:hypothetical protein ACOMHN_024276 [Nucella lapillus]
MTHPHHNLLLPLFFLLLLPHPSVSEDEPISVEASIVAVEQGYTVEVECSTTETQTPRWYLGANATGNPPLPQDKSQRIFSNASTGTLTVKEAKLNDSGIYLCQTFSQQHSATFELRVYEMPTYLTEGVIIMATSGVLLLVFLGAVLIQWLQKRKRDRKRKAMAMSEGKYMPSSPPQLNSGCMICELF